MRTRVLRGLDAAAGAAVLCCLAAPVHGQLDSLRQQYLVPSPIDPVLQATPERISRAAPGMTVASPAAFGANWGEVFVGAGLQARARGALPGRAGVDGTGIVGAGFGNSHRAVGLEVAVTSLGTVESFGRFSLSAKLHRQLGGASALAVGWENLLEGERSDGGSSVYGVASTVLAFGPPPHQPFSSVTLTVGAGSGRFQREEDFENESNGIGFFGSAALRVIEPATVIADWTGQDLSIGASLRPHPALPLVLSLGAADLTGSAGDGTRFIMGFGYGIDLNLRRSTTLAR